MNGAALQKNFPETLPDACSALDKLTAHMLASGAPREEEKP